MKHFEIKTKWLDGRVVYFLVSAKDINDARTKFEDAKPYYVTITDIVETNI